MPPFDISLEIARLTMSELSEELKAGGNQKRVSALARMAAHSLEMAAAAATEDLTSAGISALYEQPQTNVISLSQFKSRRR